MNEKILLAFGIGYLLGNWKPITKPKPGPVTMEYVTPGKSAMIPATKIQPAAMIPASSMVRPPQSIVRPAPSISLIKPTSTTIKPKSTLTLSPMRSRLTTLRDFYECGYF